MKHIRFIHGKCNVPRHDHLMQVSLYNFNDNNAHSNYRGSDFRTDYADIQELR